METKNIFNISCSCFINIKKLPKHPRVTVECTTRTLKIANRQWLVKLNNRIFNLFNLFHFIFCIRRQLLWEKIILDKPLFLSYGTAIVWEINFKHRLCNCSPSAKTTCRKTVSFRAIYIYIFEIQVKQHDRAKGRFSTVRNNWQLVKERFEKENHKQQHLLFSDNTSAVKPISAAIKDLRPISFVSYTK